MSENEIYRGQAEQPRERHGDIPQDWKVVEWHGFLGFPTRVRYQTADALQVEWNSRRQRKQKRHVQVGRSWPWWLSTRLSWWMCTLFMVGSFAFAAGALLSFIPSLPGLVPGIIFFLGSLFFTSAAYLQFLETINTPTTPTQPGPEKEHPVYVTWQPHRLDWWSTATQLIGTIYFNISTFNAMRTHLTPLKSFMVVWSADFFGSVLFLVSSWLAYGEVTSALTGQRRHNLSWWIAGLNLLGSIAFGISAITSFVRPEVGEMISATATNLFTFLGAAGFFFGAFLQLKETRRENPAESEG